MNTRLGWVMLLLLGFAYLHGQASTVTAQVDALQKQHLDGLDPASAFLRNLKNTADRAEGLVKKLREGSNIGSKVLGSVRSL